MSNKFDQFEQLMSDSLNAYEAPYDAGSWAQMDQSLNQLGKAKSASTTTITVAASLTGIGIAIGGFFYFSGDADSIDQQYTAEEITYKVDTSNQPFIDAGVAPLEIVGQDVEDVPASNNATPEINNDPQGIVAQNGNDNNTTPGDNTPAEVVPNEVTPQDNNGAAVVDNNTPDTPTPNNNQIDAPQQTIEQPATFNIVQSSTEGCEGLFVDFSIDNRQLAGDFLWNFGDGTTSSERSTVHSYKKPGDYDVILTVTNGKNVYVKTADHTVRVFENPDVKFSYELSEQNAEPATIFTNGSSNAISYNWNFGDGETSSEKSPAHRYLQKGTYTVSLEATNVYNCVTKISEPVTIDRNYNLFAPTGFTPNGDKKNDTWIPRALEVLDVDFTLTLYDSQNGNLVYETTEASNPWDGLDRSTGTVHDGQYIWVLVIKDQFGQDEVYKGYVTLTK